MKHSQLVRRRTKGGQGKQSLLRRFPIKVKSSVLSGKEGKAIIMPGTQTHAYVRENVIEITRGC